MEYTELADYPLPDGAVTTWSPVCAPESWTDDDRRLTHDHEAHLASAADGSWIGSVLRIPLRHDAGALRRALRAWIARHEALRTTVSRDGESSWRRHLVAEDAVDVDPQPRGELTGSAAHDLIADFFAGVTPDRWPHCRFATVVGDDGFVLAFGADHSVMDAYSQLLFFGEIVELYERALAGDRDGEMAALDVGSHVDHSAAARSLSEVVDAEHPVVAHWREFLHDGEFPAMEGASPQVPASSELPQHSLSRWAVRPADADRMERLCSNLGTGPQSGVFAAIALAMRERTGSERLRFVLPMHTRSDRRHAGAVGWYVGLCPVDVDLGGVTDFGEVVARTRAGISGGRGCVKTSFARVADILELDAEPRFVMSYVDVRKVPGSERWPEWNARALRSPEPSRDEVYLWLVHSDEGISVSARCGRSERSLLAVESLITGFEKTFTEVLGAPEALEVGA
ncbi:condensation domain-containing protein [Saccharopolyspora sp. ID03-671]|uniref:condensation domain-containing protein n=1 Tax=Saccharopolyspora sp. ID03-671 TaxID=3073066 RepID=UPI00324E31C4